MIDILGKRYMNDKEAAQRYGYSQSWFKHRRNEKKAPNYIKIQGKIFYDVEETDKWFKSIIQNF